MVLREDDNEETILRKLRVATIIGTLQSTLTNFPYVRKGWVDNAEEERLLGVSLTGIQDCNLLKDPSPKLLQRMRDHCVEVNKDFAAKLGIEPSKAITTTKPSGTVSQLVNSASGIHGRYAPYYLRSVRQNNSDPLTQFLKDRGVSNEPSVTDPDNTTVFYFPQKSPKASVIASEQTAISQLENWLLFKRNWAEHSVSITVYVAEDEWLEVGAWVYKNFDSITGVSFLPRSNATYKQAPYEEITEQEYNRLVSEMPDALGWSELSLYEFEDNTEGAQTLACTSGVCEL